jgi:hypothetical protein
VITRKVSLSSVVDHPVLGKLKKYKCDLNSSARIKKELKPKTYIYSELSRLNLDDTLKSEKLIVLVPIRLIFDKIGGHSGRHSAQSVHTGCFTFAEITLPFDHLIHAISNRIESEKKKLIK